MKHHFAGCSRVEGRNRCVLILIVAALLGLSSAGGQTDEEEDHNPLQVQNTVASRDGNMVVEMMSMKDDPGGRVVSVHARDLRTGKSYGLPMSDGGLETAALSEDGRYIVLEYHISSGGDAAAFERTKKGEYRKFVDNGYAAIQIRAGKVKGIRESDFPNTRGRNMYHGLGLAHSPDRLVFTLHGRFVLDYSLEKRRITGWQRSLLYCGWWGKEGQQSIRLDEMSDRRGIGLFLCASRRDGGDSYERLVTFNPVQPTPQPSTSPAEFRLRSGEEEFVELAARQVKPAATEDDGTWLVEITGRGAEFDALRGKLTVAWRQHDQLPPEKKTIWPAPMSFLATPE